METKGNKPSLGWAILSLVLPVAMILYGTLVVGVRPPVLPLIGAVALAGLMGLKTGYRWEELQEGMFEGARTHPDRHRHPCAGRHDHRSVARLGDHSRHHLLGAETDCARHLLLSAMVLCSVASIATGTSFGTMGTIGVALLGVGQALGYPPAMTVGAIVSGAYIGDKMSPVSDSTNITASVCEVPLFDHILSMLWTTVPAFVAAGIVYTVLGFSFAQEQTASLESLNAILSGLEGHFSLDFVAFIPPILMIALAYKRFPVLPVMVACLLSAVAIAVYEGVAFNDLAKMMTSGYVSKTGIKQLDPLLSRGGLLSIMPTVLLLCSGMAFGGILERSRVLEVLLDAVLKGARSAVRLVASVLAAAYIINLGTGSQMLAVIVPGRAFLDSFKKADISPLVLSRTCEDAGTIGCPLVPWSVHAFYIAGVLGVSAFDFAPYAFLNWFVPIFSILCALTGFGIWRLNGTPVHGSRKA